MSTLSHVAALLGAVIFICQGAQSPTEIGRQEIVDRFKRITRADQTNRAYHMSGNFELPDQKVAGSFELFQKDAERQWIKVHIPKHGNHLRVRNRNLIWHFDPPPNTRGGDDWFIYDRPGYKYETNEAQIRLHETFNLFDSLEFTGQPQPVKFEGREAFELTHNRQGGRSSTDIFDSASGLLLAVKYSAPKIETVLLSDYKDRSGLKFPSRIIGLAGEQTKKTNDIFTITSFAFEDVQDSKFAMPLRVRDWPAKWNEFDEAYPPPSFVKETWPWKGEHSRYFQEGFSETNSPFFWSYVVFNSLEGDTLKTAAELSDALHRYDAALYGEAFAPEKIKVTVSRDTTEQKQKHEVTRRTIQIDGFDAEATRKPLTTYLQVFRWYCPEADRTGMMVLRSPRQFNERDEVWKTLLGFWSEAECHHSAQP